MGYLNISTSHSFLKENIFSIPETQAINQLCVRLLKVSRYYEKLKLEISAVAYFINPMNNTYLNPILKVFRMLRVLQNAWKLYLGN